MASLTRWTSVWVSSGSWWCRWKPGMLQSMGLQNQTLVSNWTEDLFCIVSVYSYHFFLISSVIICFKQWSLEKKLTSFCPIQTMVYSGKRLKYAKFPFISLSVHFPVPSNFFISYSLHLFTALILNITQLYFDNPTITVLPFSKVFSNYTITVSIYFLLFKWICFILQLKRITDMYLKEAIKG